MIRIFLYYLFLVTHFMSLSGLSEGQQPRAVGSLAEYSFIREQCLKSVIIDRSTYKKGGDLHPISGRCDGCIASNGYKATTEGSLLYSDAQVSSTSIKDAQSSIAEGPYSIELWMKASALISKRVALLSIDPPLQSTCPFQIQVY